MTLLQIFLLLAPVRGSVVDDPNMRAAVEVDALGQQMHIKPRLEVVKPAALTESHAEVQHPIYDELRVGCVRLQAVVHDKDLFKPWTQHDSKGVFVGSGFVVRNIETGPLIVTNAHVVSDAQHLTIQVPAHSQQMYLARVLLVNHDMDIALVSLADVSVYKQMKTQVGRDLPVYELQDEPPKLGAGVIALGYPLGVSTMKLTKGVISGHEEVGQYMAFQQSAPISPGNSGGPLVLDGTNTVVGINFAAAVAPGSQNNNYVIPAARVKQMLNLYDMPKDGSRLYSSEDCRADRTKCEVKMPGLQMQAVPGSADVYERYGCKTGIMITRTLKDSIFAHADPPVSHNAFITSVNGVEIDHYGSAIAAEYFNDPVPFSEHMFMEPNLEPVEVGVCMCGEESTSKVPLMYGGNLTMESTVPDYQEPNLHYGLGHPKFERFAGITVQPLTVPLVQAMLQQRQRMDLVQFLPGANTDKPEAQLVVTDVDAMGPGHQIVQVGDIVDNVNGKKVHTIEDFRKAFVPTGEAQCTEGKSTGNGWVLEARSGREVVADFHEQLDTAHKSQGSEPLTLAVADALKDKGVKAESLITVASRLAPAQGEGLDGVSKHGYEELALELSARPVEERTNVRRGGMQWFGSYVPKMGLRKTL